MYSDYTEEPPVVQTSIMTSEEVLSDIFLNKTLMVGVPPRLYPAWLMREVTSPVGKTHEDAFIVVDLFSRVERVAVDTTPRYFYCHNEETITSSPSTPSRMRSGSELSRETILRMRPFVPGASFWTRRTRRAASLAVYSWGTNRVGISLSVRVIR